MELPLASNFPRGLGQLSDGGSVGHCLAPSSSPNTTVQPAGTPAIVTVGTGLPVEGRYLAKGCPPGGGGGGGGGGPKSGRGVFHLFLMAPKDVLGPQVLCSARRGASRLTGAVPWSQLAMYVVASTADLPADARGLQSGVGLQL